MTTLIGVSATASVSIADPVWPDGVHVEWQPVAGYHNTMGGRGMDYRGKLANLTVKWTELTEAQFSAITGYYFSGVTLYLRLPDYGTNAREWSLIPARTMPDDLVLSPPTTYLHNFVGTFYSTTLE